MTDAKRPRNDPDKILESVKLAGTLDSGESVVPPTGMQAAKSDAITPADLSEPDVVHNIDDLESIMYDSGSNPRFTKQESRLLEEEMDTVAEAIVTLAVNRGMGIESTAEDEAEMDETALERIPGLGEQVFRLAEDEAETVETVIEPVNYQQEVSVSQGSGEKAKTAATDLDDPPSAKQNSADRPSGKLPLFGLLIGLLGIAVGLGTVFYAYLLQDKLAVLDQRVEATVQTLPPAEVARLHIRVEEIATLIEESRHMQDSSGEEIDSLKTRIAKMEQEVGGLRDNAADRSSATEAKIPSLTSATRITLVPAASKEPWVVNVESLTSEEEAAAAVIRLRNMGINAETYAHIKDGTTWYRVRVPGFSSSVEAQAYAKNVLTKAGFSQAWIGPMQ